MTNFPGGVSSFGLPVLPSSVPATSGSVFFVHSVTGSNGNSGATPVKPFATVVYALTRCTAAKGDTIICMPGHTEAVVAAGTITVSKSGVRIIGLGTGRQKPVITYTTAAAASVDVTAASVLLQNMAFVATGIDAVTAAINVSAADVIIRGCELELASAAGQAVLGVLTTAAADRLWLDQNHIHGSDDAGTVAAVRIVGGDSIQVTNNVMIGAYTTTLGGIDNVTTALSNAVVNGNTIINKTAASSKAMVFVATSTLVFANNRLGVLSGVAPVTAAAGTNGGGNYYSAAAGVAAATLL